VDELSDGTQTPVTASGPYPETWGPVRFGDPCRDCGFAWSLTSEQAIASVLALPDRFAHLIGSADGSRRHPDLEWNVGAYVCHVADNLHIWAQWLAGAALAGEARVPGYEEKDLGDARFYTKVPVGGALWLLRQATRPWHEAVTVALAHDVVLAHESRGPQSVHDVVRSNAHDAFHHGWDIGRILDYAGGSGGAGGD
jgi:hypothetical protein